MNKEVQNKLIKRLNVIQGQLNGLKKMISDNKYCVDIIVQSSAIKNSISSVEDELLKNHLSTCVINQIKSGKKDTTIEEIIRIYKLSKKK